MSRGGRWLPQRRSLGRRRCSARSPTCVNAIPRDAVVPRARPGPGGLRSVAYAVIACFPLGLRRVGLRVLDQREVHPLDFPAILAPERIDSLPLAVVGAVVPVVPPVAR